MAVAGWIPSVPSLARKSETSSATVGRWAGCRRGNPDAWGALWYLGDCTRRDHQAAGPDGTRNSRAAGRDWGSLIETQGTTSDGATKAVVGSFAESEPWERGA